MYYALVPNFLGVQWSYTLNRYLYDDKDYLFYDRLHQPKKQESNLQNSQKLRKSLHNIFIDSHKVFHLIFFYSMNSLEVSRMLRNFTVIIIIISKFTWFLHSIPYFISWTRIIWDRSSCVHILVKWSLKSKLTLQVICKSRIRRRSLQYPMQGLPRRMRYLRKPLDHTARTQIVH